VSETDYSAALLALGPRAYWKMDESTGLFVDSASGGSWPMTPASVALAQTPPTGPFTIAPHWNGSSSQAHSGVALGDLSIVTLTAWISYDDLATGKIIWEYTANSNVGNSSSPAGFYLLQDTPDTAVSWFCNLGPDYPTNNSYAAAPSAAQWHHVVVVLDYTQPAASEVKLYVDGVAQSLTAFGTQRDHASGQLFASDTLWVGARAGSSLFGKFFMRHLAVIPGALSPAQIAALYASMSVSMKSRVGLAI
jgi:hypothetical protein